MADLLRKREKQLARATRAMREVAQEIEKLAFNGPMVIDPADLLGFAAKLAATRQAILLEKANDARTVELSVPEVVWTAPARNSDVATD